MQAQLHRQTGQFAPLVRLDPLKQFRQSIEGQRRTAHGLLERDGADQVVGWVLADQLGTQCHGLEGFARQLGFLSGGLGPAEAARRLRRVACVPGRAYPGEAENTQAQKNRL